VLAGLAILLLGDALLARAGLVAGAVPRPEGPWIWTASRATGVAAFVALTLEVVLGLLLSTRAGDRLLPRARSVDLHQWLSTLGLGLVALHGLLLAADSFVRFDVLDTLVPFLAPYRPVAVGLGVLAGWAAVVVHASFALRKRLGAKTWRRLHGLSFAAYALAVVHTLAAGTDAGHPALRALVLGSAAVVLGLAAVRIAGNAPKARESAAGGLAGGRSSL